MSKRLTGLIVALVLSAVTAWAEGQMDMVTTERYVFSIGGEGIDLASRIEYPSAVFLMVMTSEHLQASDVVPLYRSLAYSDKHSISKSMDIFYDQYISPTELLKRQEYALRDSEEATPIKQVFEGYTDSGKALEMVVLEDIGGARGRLMQALADGRLSGDLANEHDKILEIIQNGGEANQAD